MKSSIEIPGHLLDQIKEYNEKNPDDKINVSAECRKALKQKLSDVGVKVPGQ